MTPRQEAYLQLKATIARQIEEHKAAQDRITTHCSVAIVVTVVAGALAIFAPIIAWLLL